MDTQNTDPKSSSVSPDESLPAVFGRRWRDVLSGRGALYLSATGNRYNTVLQQAAYVSDDLRVAVTEFAYYAARLARTRGWASTRRRWPCSKRVSVSPPAT